MTILRITWASVPSVRSSPMEERLPSLECLVDLLDALLVIFLAVQNSSKGDLVTQSVSHSLTGLLLLTKSNPRDSWPLRHLIRVMRRHDNSWQFLTIPTIFDNFLLQFWTISTIFNNVDNFQQSWHFLTIFTNFWQFWQLRTIEDNFDNSFYHFDNLKDNPGDLWHLRHWLQLRIWIHNNFCYLTINFNTGQHSQYLQCFICLLR